MVAVNLDECHHKGVDGWRLEGQCVASEKEYNSKCSQSYRTEFVSVGIAVLASTVWMLTGHWMILDGMGFVRGLTCTTARERVFLNSSRVSIVCANDEVCSGSQFEALHSTLDRSASLRRVLGVLLIFYIPS